MRTSEPGRFDSRPSDTETPSRIGSKLALLVGFGGVLVLMVIAGIDSIRVVHRIEFRQVELTRTYLARQQALEGIRAALYHAGNAARDFLTATEPKQAEARAAELRRVRTQMESALKAYSRYVPEQETELFAGLSEAVKQYWEIVTPIREWSPLERRRDGFAFLNEQVAPYRQKLLEVSGRIGALNQGAVDASDRSSATRFESFRRRIGGVLLLALGLAGVLAVASILRILHLENEARLRYEEIVKARGELEELSARLVAAHEEERRRISRELHDETGQSLSALQVDLGNLAAVISPDNEEAHRLIRTARELAERTLRSIRDMALLLRPSMLDDLGLAPALEWQAREVSRRTGIRVNVEAEETGERLPEELRTCVYRVVQEALHNTQRHSGAKRVLVQVVRKENRLRVVVRDDGRGFDPVLTRGMGLLGMEERVRHLGGRFAVESRPGGGAAVRIELPIEEAHPAAKGA